MASHLHLPLQEVKAKTSSTEFIQWMEYLEREVNAFHREDYYLAQIVAAIFKVNVEHPRRVRLEDFLLKFRTKKKGEAKVKVGWKERMRRSKSFWLGALGLKGKLKDGR